VALPDGGALDLSAVPLTEGLEAAEEAWAGGVGDFGNPGAPYLAQQMPGYFDYRGTIEDLVRVQLGDSFVMYRSIDPSEWDEWRQGIVQDLRSFTFDRELACRWGEFVGHRDKERWVMRALVLPQAVVLRGKQEESELVLDGQWIPSADVALVTTVCFRPAEFFTLDYLDTRVPNQPPRFLFHFTRSAEHLEGILRHGIRGNHCVVSVTENPAGMPGQAVLVLDSAFLLRRFALWPCLWQRNAPREAEWVIATADFEPYERGSCTVHSGCVVVPLEAVVEVGFFPSVTKSPQFGTIRALARQRGIPLAPYDWMKWWERRWIES